MIYLDSAATTLQKPNSVAHAASWAIQHAASPGRGGHPAAMKAADIVFACREEAAALFRVPDPSRVVCTFNATHGLNIAIKTLVRPGNTVVISGYEHNAVTRPLSVIPNVNIRIAASPLFEPKRAVQVFEEELKRGADVAVCNHISNVFGYVLPIGEIAALCRQYRVPLIIDASQSAGVMPINMGELGAAFIAMPGHKGLYGPQGTGLLLCGDDILPATLIEGGTGSSSLQQNMPDFLPDRLEPGTHNVAGIAGLLQGIRFVRHTGMDAIAAHERKLIWQLVRGLQGRSNAEVFCAQQLENQSGVLSIRVRGKDCEQLGEWLARKGVAVRPGLHCAPLAHKSAGTLETGTVRISVSAFNTVSEINQFLNILQPVLR